MPRFMRRRLPRKTVTEPPMAEPDLVEQEILADARRLAEQEHRIGRKWARRMGPLFWLGWLTTVPILYAAGSNTPAGVIAIGLVSVAVNVTSWHAIRMGRVVAPERFPVTWIGRFGQRVSGANTSLLLAAVSGSLVLFAVRAVLA